MAISRQQRADNDLLKLRPQRWMAWVVLLLGIGLSIFIWHSSVERTHSLANSRFEARTNELHGALNTQLATYAQILHGASAYIGATGHPDKKQFSHLYRSLRIGEELKGFSVLAYLRHITPENRRAHEIDVRRDYPKFDIRPAGEREEHVVVTGVEPQTAANLPAIGADSYHHPARREALDAARDTGQIRITSKLKLVIDDPEKPEPAFLMYQANYRDGELPESVNARREKLTGFVLGAFRINTLIAGTFGTLPGDIAFRVYDGYANNEESLYYASHPDFKFQTAHFLRTQTLTIGGRTWLVEYAGLPAFDEELGDSAQAQRPLLAGLLVSLMLFAIAWTLANTRTQAIALAHKMTRSLTESETKLRALFDQAPVGIWLFDGKRTIIDCNEKFAGIIGEHRDNIIGSRIPISEESETLDVAIQQAMRGNTLQLESAYQSSSLYNWHFQPVIMDGEQAFVLCFVEDISARKFAEAHIAHLAHHDTLTGLANRGLLKDRLQQAIATATRNQSKLALLFIDLDFFKNINDTVGHSAGDALLVQVANRLRRCVRESDTLARIGGDEFVILLSSIINMQSSIRVAEAVIEQISRPIRFDAHQFNITGSIGIAIWPDDGEDAEELTRNADVAMYHAKKAGRNNYQFFTPEMTARAREMAAMEISLREALQRNQFRLHFQPQVDAQDGRIVGAEALLRWQHPELGLLPPDRFIDVAEARGLIHDLGRWVLHAACQQAQHWRENGYPALTIAVNISPIQLRKKTLLDDVAEALAQSGLPPVHLAIEVTEGAVMEDIAGAIELLRKIEKLGVVIEIDDFGTGHSSLAYLKQLPIHRLKIDRSFVTGIPNDADDVAIVETIITLAGSLKLQVIAEGVETDEQRQFLIAHNCTAMQGYFFSRPVAADEFTTLLNKARP